MYHIASLLTFKRLHAANVIFKFVEALSFVPVTLRLDVCPLRSK